MESLSTSDSRTSFEIPAEPYAYNQGVTIKEEKGKENYHAFKSRDKYSGSWINDPESGSIYKTKMTSRGSVCSERHSSLGPMNYVESFGNSFSNNWVFNGRNKLMTATSSELPAFAGSNNGNIKFVATVSKTKTKKSENQSKKDTVVPHQVLNVPPSNGAIIRYPNTRSRQINPSQRIHPLVRNAEAPVIQEVKTVEKEVRQLTKATGSSGNAQRISRSQRKKALCIVLEKQHTVASMETLSDITRSKKDGKGKRRINEMYDAQNAVPVKRKRLSSEVKTVKNSNSDWHCLNKTIKCQLCKTSPGKSLVSHYVNCHPNNEVFPCRVAPHVADFLRHSTKVQEVERFMPRRKVRNEFRQLCYFCNEVKSFTKSLWGKHIVLHTGYYSYKCSTCKRRFAASTPYHACNKGKIKNRVVNEAMHQFNETDVFAYLCDLCNFVRFEESEMEKHMSCEHEGNVTKKFKKVIFLRFPKKKQKNEIVVEPTTKPNSQKLSTTVANLDKTATGLLEQSPQKVLQMNVVQLEAFIAEPIENIGLSGHDTMKLMEDTHVNASEDAECSSRSNNRATPVDVKLNPRYNSLQVDGHIISTDTEQSEATSLNRMNVLMEGEEDIPTVEETSKACVKGENDVPTKEEYFVKSNYNYESCSLSPGEDESVSSIQVTSPSNINYVGINDTIASLEHIIPTQGESTMVDGLNELQKTTTVSDSNSKRQAHSSITTNLFYLLNTLISIGIFAVFYLLFSSYYNF